MATQVVRFRSLEKPKDEFSLELSKLQNYDDVVQRVARHLGLNDPSKIRLTSHNCYSQQPKPQPIQYRGVKQLSDMLVDNNQTSDILYYEVLDIPLPELQNQKTLRVGYHHATNNEVVIHTIQLPKQSTVKDLINQLKTKVELSHPNAELRLLEIFHHKIYKIFPLNQKINDINDQYWTIRVEEIPREEKTIGPSDKLIPVCHFVEDTVNQVQVQNFGEPFLLIIHDGETLAEVKVRIQKKFQVPDEEFWKWRFAFLSLDRHEYLQDLDILTSHFQRRDVYGAWEQFLGLEHSDSVSKKSHAAAQQKKKRSNAANQNRRSFEKQWQGSDVSAEYVPILDRIGALYPNTYKSFSCETPTFQAFVLSSLAQTLLDMQKCRVGDVTAVEAVRFRRSFKDLEREGLDVSWMSSRLDNVLKVVDSTQLFKELAKIEKQLEEARKTITRLEQDHARVTAQVEVRVGSTKIGIGLDQSVGDGLL